jgi:hypothetical protein
VLLLYLIFMLRKTVNNLLLAITAIILVGISVVGSLSDCPKNDISTL